MTQEDELLTVAEAARLLRVTPHTIYRWISAGRLPAVRYSRRVLRIPRGELASLSRGAVQEARAPYEGASGLAGGIDEEEQQEIERFFKRYEELRDRPRPAGAPPKGSVEALFQHFGAISKEAGEELYRLIMEDRAASLKDPD